MSANSRPALLFFVSIALLIAIVASVYFRQSPEEHLQPLQIAGNTAHVSIADTAEKRELGLSGRAGLAPDEGMLFIFPTEGKYSFWMKDMRFAIDILWIASDGTIVYTKEGASPDTFPQTFVSYTPAQYVLEVSSGYIMRHRISIGQKVER